MAALDFESRPPLTASNSTARISPLDLDALESDPTPIFLIKFGIHAIGFELLFCNGAFRKERLKDVVLTDDSAAIRFRAWAQAADFFDRNHKFAHRRWSARAAGDNGDWKIVSAVRLRPSLPHEVMQPDGPARFETSTAIWKRSDESVSRHSDTTSQGSLQHQIHPSLDVRWETHQAIMEMSDVGVFEFSPHGTLIFANEAWYKLRLVRPRLGCTTARVH
jgi:hypothetical protein